MNKAQNNEFHHLESKQYDVSRHKTKNQELVLWNKTTRISHHKYTFVMGVVNSCNFHFHWGGDNSEIKNPEKQAESKLWFLI